jgi:hypothetical protein
MIAGPELTDDRTAVLDLLASQADLLEKDLVLLEHDLELGSRFVLDGLLRDGAGRPVLLFVTGASDEPDLTSRILDCEAWVRDNSFLLRRHLGRAGIHWDQAPRCVVVGHEVHHACVRKIRALSGIEIDVFELRMLRVAGRTFWAGVRCPGSPVADGRSGPGPERIWIDDPGLRALWDAMLDAVGRIDRRLFFEGDRYREDAIWNGHSLATFRAAEGLIRVDVAGDARGELLVHDDRSMRSAVDAVLRKYLHVRAAAAVEPGPRTVDAVHAGPPVHELPAGRAVPGAVGEGLRMEADPPGFKPHVLRSS